MKNDAKRIQIQLEMDSSTVAMKEMHVHEREFLSKFHKDEMERLRLDFAITRVDLLRLKNILWRLVRVIYSDKISKKDPRKSLPNCRPWSLLSWLNPFVPQKSHIVANLIVECTFREDFLLPFFVVETTEMYHCQERIKPNVEQPQIYCHSLYGGTNTNTWEDNHQLIERHVEATLPRKRMTPEKSLLTTNPAHFPKNLRQLVSMLDFAVVLMKISCHSKRA